VRSRSALVGSAAVGVVLAVLVALLAFTDAGDDGPGRSTLLDRPARTLAGSVIHGEGEGGRFDLVDVLDAGDGRFVLVNFFAAWCEPCRLEHDDLLAFASGNDDVQVVSVVLQDKPENVRAFFEAEGGDWPVVDDPGGAIAVRWGVTQPPESFLIGPEGIVRARIVGGATVDGLDALLARERLR
jgi:cytochrome c biogenesis protein CcmG/thiol:disulfide interchange protein DsbE